MSSYTVELREIVKSDFNIFDFNYSFYDDTKKLDFEEKFINHFYFREIGTETVGRFKKHLINKFNEVLPFYNMLFNTALITYEKTINYNLTETMERDVNKNDNIIGNIRTNETKEGIINSNKAHTNETDFLKKDAILETGINEKDTETDNSNISIESDTPSGLLSMVDISANVYASKADIINDVIIIKEKDTSSINKNNNIDELTHITENENLDGTNRETLENTNNASQNTIGAEKENYTKIMRGSYGVITEADMLKKHIDLQQTLTTILTKFFDECEDLFMQIY